jgi:NAD(P)-dependent dehydrogenase (short-subunit alcohol dehydrogenase family)
MKTAIITGASSGIGKQIARQFSQGGWATILIARRQDQLEALAQELENAEVLPCDLSDSQCIEALKETLSNQSVDALINNAGIFIPQSVDEDSDETWEKHFQVNLMSAVRLTRICWPQLKESKGCVLNISSTLGIRPIANTGAYSALKAAMNNWTLSLAIEGAPHAIRANAICPGIVDTPIHSYVGSEKPEDQEIYQAVQKAQPLGRTGKPEDIAVSAFHFCQPHSEWITGSVLNIDGGILLNS